MVLPRTALIAFFVFLFCSLRAFDFVVHVDMVRAKTVPGWEALQKICNLEYVLKTDLKFKQQGIDFSLTGFTMLSEGNVLDLQLDGIDEKLLDHLHPPPSRTIQEENGIYHITGENGEKFTFRSTEGGLHFSSGAIRNKTLLNFQKQKTAIIQGVLLRTGEKDQPPFLSDVSTIYFYLNEIKESFVIDLYISGGSTQANKQIRKDLNSYFAELYANAAKQMVLDPSFYNIYRVSEEKGWVKLQITLTPEQAKEFFEQFGSSMKEMLSM